MVCLSLVRVCRAGSCTKPHGPCGHPGCPDGTHTSGVLDPSSQLCGRGAAAQRWTSAAAEEAVRDLSAYLDGYEHTRAVGASSRGRLLPASLMAAPLLPETEARSDLDCQCLRRCRLSLKSVLVVLRQSRPPALAAHEAVRAAVANSASASGGHPGSIRLTDHLVSPSSLRPHLLDDERSARHTAGSVDRTLGRSMRMPLRPLHSCRWHSSVPYTCGLARFSGSSDSDC